MKYDYLIVGCGFFGATCANLLHKSGKKILCIDKNIFYGGHCHTEKIDGIMVHKYGPHVFHTNNKDVWDYVNQFSEFNNYRLKVRVNYNNKLFSFPINLLTLYQIFGCTTPQEAEKYVLNDLINIEKPSNFEELALKTVGKKIYETFFYGYTKKQWGCEPQELSSEVFGRIPIRYNFNDSYFNNHRNRFEGIPINGYSSLIENMLSGIEMKFGIDFLQHKNEFKNIAKQTIFTGPIDQFFNYEYGLLPYRSLKFEYEKHNISDYQGAAVINYTDEKIPFTRITEHNHFNPQELSHTIISKEYSTKYDGTNEPYYPINNAQNNLLFNKYLEKAQKSNIVFGGRLGQYKYFDMDQTIESAMELIKSL